MPTGFTVRITHNQTAPPTDQAANEKTTTEEGLACLVGMGNEKAFAPGTGIDEPILFQ